MWLATGSPEDVRCTVVSSTFPQGWSSQYKPCLTVGLTRYYVAVSGLVFVDLRIM